ncbi:uncharacterized protein DFL_006329 [Arthrobotrys flagrans]|uniref:Uncharacterized protein n=1 Tax=Arthrobotrys flagrans TaxID=97331 RepID=A0A437A025_ARTFL|nr:hypothetical protein DFL_006329 [Arthrobotrys flagrans]
MRVSILFTSFLLTATALAAPYGSRLYSRQAVRWTHEVEQLNALQQLASGTDEEIRLAAHEAGMDDIIKVKSGTFTAHAGGSLIKKIGLNLMGTLGVPKDMLELIGAVPDDMLKKMIKQPLGQLKSSLDSLKAGKIPNLPGVAPKELILQVLPNLGVPDNMVNLIKAAPDSFISKITDLPGGQLSSTIKELKAGKIPTIPGVDKADMILQFLPSLGLPSLVVDILKATPGAIEQLGNLDANQLDKLLKDFKEGKFTGIPGLDLGGTPTLPTNPTTPTTPTTPSGSTIANPVLPVAPVSSAVPSTPVTAPVLPADPDAPVGTAPAAVLPDQPVASAPAGTLPVASAPAGIPGLGSTL